MHGNIAMLVWVHAMLAAHCLQPSHAGKLSSERRSEFNETAFLDCSNEDDSVTGLSVLVLLLGTIVGMVYYGCVSTCTFRPRPHDSRASNGKNSVESRNSVKAADVSRQTFSSERAQARHLKPTLPQELAPSVTVELTDMQRRVDTAGGGVVRAELTQSAPAQRAPGAASRCPYCSASRSADDSFCSSCGKGVSLPSQEPRTTFRCIECSESIAQGEQSCSACGTGRHQGPQGSTSSSWPAAPSAAPTRPTTQRDVQAQAATSQGLAVAQPPQAARHPGTIGQQHLAAQGMQHPYFMPGPQMLPMQMQMPVQTWPGPGNMPPAFFALGGNFGSLQDERGYAEESRFSAADEEVENYAKEAIVNGIILSFEVVRRGLIVASSSFDHLTWVHALLVIDLVEAVYFGIRQQYVPGCLYNRLHVILTGRNFLKVFHSKSGRFSTIKKILIGGAGWFTIVGVAETFVKFSCIAQQDEKSPEDWVWMPVYVVAFIVNLPAAVLHCPPTIIFWASVFYAFIMFIPWCLCMCVSGNHLSKQQTDYHNKIDNRGPLARIGGLFSEHWSAVNVRERNFQNAQAVHASIGSIFDFRSYRGSTTYNLWVLIYEEVEPHLGNLVGLSAEQTFEGQFLESATSMAASGADKLMSREPQMRRAGASQ